MRRLVPTIVLLALLGALLLPAVAGATAQGRSTLFPLRKGTEAQALAVGHEGYLWFAGVHRGAGAANVVGRISPRGAVDEYTVPGTGSVLGIGDLTRGPNGDMWFTEPLANRIGWVSPSGHPETFTVPIAGSRPTGIVTTPGGFLWVTLEGTGRLTQISPIGLATTITLPAGSRPTAIALGPDSTPWVIDSGRATLTHRSAPGTTITFPLPTKGGNFTARTANSDIVTGPEGDLWLSQSDGPFVARVEPRETKAEYTRYRIPTVGEGTSLISNGPDGDIWFAGGSVIGSISTRRTEGGEVACAVPGCEGPIRALSKGPEGALWFALGSDLGRFRPPALHLRLPKGSPHRNGKTVPVAIECRGGAAGDICDGKVELLLRQGSHKAVSRPLGQARFTIRTMKRHKVTLRLSDRALRLLSAQGDLRVRLVATVAGKVVANRKYLLRGGR